VSKEEEFRAQAAECDKLADHTTDPEAKLIFREAAENWRKMADQRRKWWRWSKA
jgi:hypothetical protein